MSDQYYGYTPVQLPSYVAQYQDYSYGVTMPTYVPTAWDDYNRTNIDSMWEWISSESDERVTAVADMWRRIYTLLEVTADHLRTHTDALAQKWNSDASRTFTEQVGRALYSMDEWGQVALNNALALDLVAGAIKGNQSGAKRVYEEYVQAYNHPGSVPGSAPTHSGGSGKGVAEDENHRRERMRKAYTPKIKPYVKQVADTYMDVFFNYLGRGGQYQGPTNAVYTDPKKLLPHGGGGGLPSPGSLPTPDFSKALTASLRAATASQLPDPLTLAGGQTTPTLPHPTLPGPGLPGTNVPNPPAGPPGLTGLPGLPPPGETVSYPGRPRGGALPPEEGGFGRPTIPGGRPNLSGRQPPRAGRPPAGRGGTPNLRGSRGRLPGGGLPESAGLAEELEHPNARAPLPPRLSGRRTPTEGTRRGVGAPGEEQFPHTAPPRGRALGERGNRTGLRRGAAGPGGEETPRPGLPRGRSGEPGERLSGRRGPGGPVEEQDAFRRGVPDRPDLSGRTRPRAAVPEEPAEPGRVLRGAPGEPARSGPGPVPPRGSQRRKEQRDAAAPPGAADEQELWAVDQAAPAVLDAPEPVRPVDPGPALGR